MINVREFLNEIENNPIRKRIIELEEEIYLTGDRIKMDAIDEIIQEAVALLTTKRKIVATMNQVSSWCKEVLVISKNGIRKHYVYDYNKYKLGRSRGMSLNIKTYLPILKQVDLREYATRNKKELAKAINDLIRIIPCSLMENIIKYETAEYPRYKLEHNIIERTKIIISMRYHSSLGRYRMYIEKANGYESVDFVKLTDTISYFEFLPEVETALREKFLPAIKEKFAEYNRIIESEEMKVVADYIKLIRGLSSL